MVWRFYKKASTLFIVVVGVLTFGIAEYYVDIRPPGFREELKNSVINNRLLMQNIGDWDTTEFNYTDDQEADNTFYLIVKGKCDSAFVKLNGTYSKERYTVTDSVIRKCK